MSSATPLLGRLPTPPEDLQLFRLGRLLLLFDEVAVLKSPKPLDVERLGIYDFFAASPFLIFPESTRQGLELTLSGFESHALGYQSSFHRFTTRRERMRADISRLVALGLVTVEARDGKVAFAIAEPGSEYAQQFCGLYAQMYRKGASLVAKQLNKLSDSRLRVSVGEWLQAEPFLIDLFDEVRAA
jgi:hypothetical protein